ncbi:vitamin K epoxide reductase family protein [Actinacidiphila acididurans]|uniref:Vitamin K epoxide reductase family protein n=1 Tax=Actinacidiphila acididurans TaxID=2784346 RepID=A0ABS2U6I1_9ACTN|nr:vitamin K epoxide reductase family protein [Actinacidiphila acididurans]MBM9509768.1 vitamin K epoxide reductase family protein [Actinacidiphila acididurans]
MTTSALDETTRTDGGSDEPGVPGGVAAGRAFTWLLLICGALGLVASFVITDDKFKLLQAKAEGKTYTPACSLNPIISCTNVMQSPQAHAFGFPNPIIGLVAYPVVMAVAMSLFAGARYRSWYWLGLQAGGLFGVVFCSWLQYQTLYTIGSLCLWCSLAWTVTIAIFWYTLVHNIKHRIIKVPAGARSLVLEFHWVVPVLWYGIIATLILTRWWSYWKTLV